MDKRAFALFLTTIAAGACAQFPTSTVSDADKSKLTTATVEAARTSGEILVSRNCVAETGTHIVRKGACVNAPGRSYDSTDIERTGSLNIGEGLIRLEPSINIRAP